MFGLSLYTTERDLRDVFSKYGPLADVNIVYDQQSRRSRGFAFVYFENSEDSKEVWMGLGHHVSGCGCVFLVLMIMFSVRPRSVLMVWSWMDAGLEWISLLPKELTLQLLGSTWDAPHSEYSGGRGLYCQWLEHFYIVFIVGVYVLK